MKVSDIMGSSPRKSYSGCGGKTNIYWVSNALGFNGEGKTKEEAESAAIDAAREAAENLGKRAYFFSPSGKTVFAVYFSGTWCYDIMSPALPYPSSTVGIASYEKACQWAKNHSEIYED